MVPPVGMNRLALTFFFEAGDAWPLGGQPDYHRGFGIEVMSEIRFGYLFGGNFRLGVARGRDEGGMDTAYIRVGRSF